MLFSAIALMVCLVAGAQVTETQSATLTLTDGTTTVYYGTDALTKAYNAAPNEGATIVLSSGTFSRPQWPCDVYSQRRTSAIKQISGKYFLPSRSAFSNA